MRYLMIGLLSATVLLLPGAIPGQQTEGPGADMNDGNGLLQACASGGKFNSNEEFANAMYCMGYTRGVSDGLHYVGRIQKPEGVTNFQIMAVAVKYMQDHPELLHQESGELVTNALVKVWGTQKKKP